MAKAYAGPVLSHWSTLIEEFNTSALDFYAAVEAAIARREIPDVKTSRVEHHESGLLSARREYLRVERGKDVYDLCAAPFGRGYFFSSWLTQKQPGLMTALAFMGTFLFVFFLAWAIAGVVVVGIFGQFLGTAMTFFVMIFASPFLFGFLAEQWGPETVAAMPVVGPVYAWIFSPATYYRTDTALMFQKSVHNAVMEVIDELTTSKGMRALAPEDRKPILAGLTHRAA